MPEKRKLFKNTSFSTSREMFSIVPGLVKPRVALRSWKVSESVEMVDVMGFSVTNEGRTALSMVIGIAVGCSKDGLRGWEERIAFPKDQS